MTEQLKVISKSRSLVKKIYEICKELPKEENYIIKPQILRASISVPSNIVEGQQRSDKEFIRFLSISRGSLEEVKIQLEIIKDNYGFDELIEPALELCDEIGKMTYRLMLRLKADSLKIK